MKKWLPEFKLILLLFLSWRLFLVLSGYLATIFIPLRIDFLGPTPWANLDGVHYLSIAKSGYYQYEQAFFPLYPLLLRLVSRWLSLSPQDVGLVISHLSFFGGLWLFYRLSRDFAAKSVGSLWAVVFLLLFPTSFFFAAVYTESLFLFLAFATVVAAKRRSWWLAGILGMLASLTRLFGVFLLIIVVWEYFHFKDWRSQKISLLAFLLIPLGLVVYMIYLWFSIKDPLAFFHAQPAFGAERSGESLILLPQVLWRYGKIILTVPFLSLNYQVAIFELTSFILGLGLIWEGSRQKLPLAYLLYALAILLTPTLTGTLSSIPRYFLSAFPLFFVLGNLHNKWLKIALAFLFLVSLGIGTAAFLRGYFIA
ncbi:MAG: mannosyltransferase family protein [Patescibacteria group bacterium]